MSNGSGRQRSRFPTLVLLLIALLTGGAVVYAAMRGGGDSADTAASETTSAEATTTETTTAAESTTEEPTATTTTSEDTTSEESTTTEVTTTTRTTTTATTTTPPAVEVASLQPTGDTRPTTGEANIDGRSYADALSLPFGGCETNGSFDYDLNGDYRTFRTVVGTTEETDTDAVVRFEVYTDDELAYSSGNLRQGETADIDIPVRDVQSLRLGYLFIDGDLSRCSTPGDVVWGDPTLTE